MKKNASVPADDREAGCETAAQQDIKIGINQAIRELGISKGQILYLKSRYPKGTRYTIDKWKGIIKK